MAVPCSAWELVMAAALASLPSMAIVVGTPCRRRACVRSRRTATAVVRTYLLPASFLDLWPEATRHESGITLDIHSLHHDNRHLSPADVALGYKQLQRLEEAWRTLKSGLRVRPVSLRAAHRIQAHVVWRVLGLWLERGIEQAWGNTWRTMPADVGQRKLAPLLSPHGEIWQVTEPSPEASTH
jgi:hypothetical protein